MGLGLIVQDDVLLRPYPYRDDASSLPFADVSIGHETFRGISPADPQGRFTRWIRAQGPYEPTLSFFRRSPKGQPEPNYIHHDAMMGDFTAILYLNPEPANCDGTIFWEPMDGMRTVANGRAQHCNVDCNGEPRWFDERFRVRAQFNRAVIFPSRWWHSRALFENYGHGADARLIQVAFGKVVQ